MGAICGPFALVEMISGLLGTLVKHTNYNLYAMIELRRIITTPQRTQNTATMPKFTLYKEN